MDRQLYFPSEGRCAEDFFALKNPTASAGFEPANLGTTGQHAIPRPPKPHWWCIADFLFGLYTDETGIENAAGKTGKDIRVQIKFVGLFMRLLE